MEKGKPTVAIDCAGIAMLDRAHVATQALCLHEKRRRCLLDRLQAGLHVQTLGSGVEGDGRLKEITIQRVEVGQAKMPGAEEIFELSARGNLGVFRIPIRQHQLRAFESQAVVHTGGLVFKGSGLPAFDGKATRVCHRCGEIVVQNLLVTRAATGVCCGNGRHPAGRWLLRAQ